MSKFRRLTKRPTKAGGSKSFLSETPTGFMLFLQNPETKQGATWDQVHVNPEVQPEHELVGNLIQFWKQHYPDDVLTHLNIGSYPDDAEPIQAMMARGITSIPVRVACTVQAMVGNLEIPSDGELTNIPKPSVH